MNIESLPTVDPPDFSGVRNPGRPILSFPWRTACPHRVPSHSHSRGHIVHLEEGSYWAVTSQGAWLVVPGQALWIPPRVEHEVHSNGAVTAQILFVDEAHAELLPQQCGTVRVNGLLTELLRRVVANGNEYCTDGPSARLALVTLDEMAGLEFAPMMLSISKEPRLARVMRRLIEDPGARFDLERVAREAGASKRTLARLFAKEMGMTLTQWKTRLRLVEAVKRLAKGESVTEVAVDLGYSPSSFIFMFRSNLGVSPRQYVAKANDQNKRRHLAH
jgi:AraC-like DNA-binding protein